MGYRVTLPLKDKSEREAEVTIDGTTAKVSIEESKVVIENVRAANPDEAQTAARTIAAKLLDILCSMYEHCLVLGEADPASERIDQVRSALVEAEDGAKTCCVSDSSCTTVMVRFADPSSDSWRLGLLPYEHLPAMASYRSAMLTQDVFHKFRDLYLAIENAAARLHPGPESGPLLETALSTVYGSSLSALCNLAA